MMCCRTIAHKNIERHAPTTCSKLKLAIDLNLNSEKYLPISNATVQSSFANGPWQNPKIPKISYMLTKIKKYCNDGEWVEESFLAAADITFEVFSNKPETKGFSFTIEHPYHSILRT
ncbi:hypothetical protein RF11_09297 [Thelohanellus kitauei]|uniref:Uncharacterized protein n=1 Tax=Thelohanellus kitauei TaxID=669202 RepID=A0A0C2MT55_THEKT|nr:hypothetical protein RF11_09297 [Thelohanellus kitauei]